MNSQLPSYEKTSLGRWQINFDESHVGAVCVGDRRAKGPRAGRGRKAQRLLQAIPGRTLPPAAARSDTIRRPSIRPPPRRRFAESPRGLAGARAANTQGTAEADGLRETVSRGPD